MDEERKWTSGFSVPRGRRAEVEAALLKLKLRRPFDSMSEIIVDALLAAAEALDKDGHEAVKGDGHQKINRAPDLQSVPA